MMLKHFDFLFVDFMVEDAHKVYCNALISALSEKYSTFVIEKKSYINGNSDNNHRIIDINTKEIVGNYPFKARFNTYYNFKNTLKELSNYTFDKIIVLGYDPVMFLLMYKKICSLGKVFLVEHHQLDEVDTSKWKNEIWNRYKNLVNHIVLDESIAVEMSKRFNINRKRIFIFPHPCIFNDKKNVKKNESGKIKVLAISNSNDVRQVNELIESERKFKYFEKSSIEIILREKEGINIDGLTAFKCIKGFLTDEEYMRLNENSDIVWMPFPLDYKYRCSGTLIDAIAAGKKVISSEVLESLAYEKKFPELCKTYSNVNTIYKLINELKMKDSVTSMKSFIDYQNTIRLNGIESIGD